MRIEKNYIAWLTVSGNVELVTSVLPIVSIYIIYKALLFFLFCVQGHGVQGEDGSGGYGGNSSGEEWHSCDSSKLNRKRKASRETGGRPSRRMRIEKNYITWLTVSGL